MTTWATLRGNVRIILSDTGDSPRFTDTELLLYCKRALDAYSGYFPMKGNSVVTSTGTDGQYTLETEWKIDRVSHETDAGYENFLEEVTRIPGRAMSYYTEGWWRVGDVLYVTPTTLEDIKVYYTTLHTHPESDTSVLTIPQMDEMLIEKYICGMAMDRYIGKAAMLDRWRDRKRDDNPIIIARHNWMKEWENLIAQRLAGRPLRLVVKGRDRPDSTYSDVTWQTAA